MPDQHPNIAIVQRFNPADLAGSAEILAEDVVWHYFNPRLPDLQGDHVGAAGIAEFFERLAALTEGSFTVEPISVEAVGDELLVMHTRNSMVVEGVPIDIDVVLVWRIVDGRITEIWDIPSVSG